MHFSIYNQLPHLSSSGQRLARRVVTGRWRSSDLEQDLAHCGVSVQGLCDPGSEEEEEDVIFCVFLVVFVLVPPKREFFLFSVESRRLFNVKNIFWFLVVSTS